MEKNLIGRFYFKLTSNGNLVGEYSHNKCEKIFSECSEPIGKTYGFLGEFNTVWQDRGCSIIGTLTISESKRSSKLYSLEWKYGDKERFFGEGFLVDNMLIGDYRDFKEIIQTK